MTIDGRHMRHALALAERGLGTTAPNPSVGCVIVSKAGHVAGRGWTQAGGRPHAETMALSAAGPQARGATAFVTLEPCAHHGQTGPCAQALIDAGIARVVSACDDPDPRVGGRGHAMIRAAGIELKTGVLRAEAEALNAGFLKRTRTGMPLVTVKIASSLDGRIALANGESQWITGPEARAAGHLLRAAHDAILTGIGTALADDPQMDCRLPGMSGWSPLRAVADSRGRLPPEARLLRNPPGGKVIVFTANPKPAMANAEIVLVSEPDGSIGIPAMLQDLGARGVTRLLIEAGPQLTTSFLKAKAVDQIVWFRSPRLLGGDARAGVGGLALDKLSDSLNFRRVAVTQWGEDTMETYAARP